MKYEITITADTNDADYITKVSPISEEDLETIKPLIEAIKNFKSYKVEVFDRHYGGNRTRIHNHNYPWGDYVRRDLGEKSPEEIYNIKEEVVDLFQVYVPHGQHGIHTIESITICPLQKKTKLL